MLKIINDMDLKSLSKYGFKRIKYLPLYQKLVYFDDNKLNKYIEYTVNTKTRFITINTRNFSDKLNDTFIIDDTIYELTKDNLIEIK